MLECGLDSINDDILRNEDLKIMIKKEALEQYN